MDHTVSSTLSKAVYPLPSPVLVKTSTMCFIYVEHQVLISTLLSPQFTHRRQQQEGRKQALGKAVGLKPHYRPFILDATGGFGVDACLLADLGCTVLILERHPLMTLLLQQALAKLRPSLQCPLHILQKDSLDYLKHHVPHITAPQVIYLDPMFPSGKKNALNKQPLRLLKALVGEDKDASELFNAAYSVATHRVVVKRPRHAPLITDKEPSYRVLGKSNRYDIYLTKTKNLSFP